MIWNNGYIQFKENDAQMFDEDGNPIADGGTWGDFIPCGYEETTNLTATSTEKSPFTAGSYKVRIKLQAAKERLKLYRKDKSLIGEFVVRSINNYDYIDETHLQCQL